MTIYCDDGQVNAHKLVLAASSLYFRNLFSKMTNSFHYPIIVLREMPIDDLKTIIQFLYHGEVHVPQNRVESLMRCAEYLNIDVILNSNNSLNAVAMLASPSTMSHQAVLAHHPGLSSSSATSSGHGANINLNAMANTNQPFALNKMHPQYPPTGASATGATTATSATNKPPRGHHSRGNLSSASNTNNNTGKPKHTCPVCLKQFTHGFTLKRHQKLHQQGRLTIYCDVCSKSYSCKDSFLRHKKSSGHLQHAEFHHRTLDMNINP